MIYRNNSSNNIKNGIFVLGVTRSSMSFEDRRVCRPFLLNCCPHEVLAGTVRAKRNSRSRKSIDVSVSLIVFSRELISANVHKLMNLHCVQITNVQRKREI